MAYKKTYRKGRKQVRRSVRKPMASLASLKKDIAILKKKTTQITERDQYQSALATDVISPYAGFQLTRYSGWSRLWPSTSTAINLVKSKMFHRYTVVDNNVTLDNINNEEGEIQFTYFCFSCKDAAGSLAPTAGGVPNLISGVDFITVGGLAYLNLKKYKIHYVKRFTLTGGDGADMQADRCQIRFSHRVKVMAKVENPDGAWRDLTESPDPSDNIYVVLISNNSAIDLEDPRWTLNAIHSVDN